MHILPCQTGKITFMLQPVFDNFCFVVLNEFGLKSLSFTSLLEPHGSILRQNLGADTIQHINGEASSTIKPVSS